MTTDEIDRLEHLSKGELIEELVTIHDMLDRAIALIKRDLELAEFRNALH